MHNEAQRHSSGTAKIKTVVLSAAEGEEKMEFSCIVDGNIERAPFSENTVVVP